MRTVYKVAKVELKMLFYSPIAWFLLVIFFLQVGVAFFAQLDPISRMLGSGAELSFSLTKSIFFGNRGVFSAVTSNLYLYLPLLTMGLISRDMSGGTIRLLYSSPINVSEIVLGKFMAIMVLNLLLTLVVVLYIVVTACFIPHPDTGLLLASLLGLYLLLCAYTAIGIFMSCLTTYQVVAAVSTFVTIWVLHSVGRLWQDIPFVRSLTYFLSISGRTNKMMSGLITSKDLIYFAAIISLFLALTIYKMRSGMESRTAWHKTGRYFMILGATLLIGYVSSIPNLVLYWDTTREKTNTIVPPAQKILRSLGDEPLEVTSYANLMGGYFDYGHPRSYNSTFEKWEPYIRFKHSIVLKTVYYYDTLNHSMNFNKFFPGKNVTEIARILSENNDMNLGRFLKPQEIRKIIDLSKEPDWYTMQLKYKGRTTMLRLYDDNQKWPTETEVTAALKRLLNEKLPKILFVTGNLERNIFKMGDRDFRGITNLGTFRYSLLNQGFDVDTISLDGQPVPTDINALVLADPKQPLSATALQRLQAYTDAGGNLMILGEPGKQSLLNPYLSQFGIQILEGTIFQKSKELQQTLATPALTEAAANLYPRLAHAHHHNARVSMPGAAPLAVSRTANSVVQQLLVVDTANNWLKKGAFVADSVEVGFMPENGDIKGAFPVAVTVARKVNGREQRIVVTGDADFMSNVELQRQNVRAANFAFSTGLFSWLSYNEYPIDSFRPDDPDTKAKITKDQVKLLRAFMLYGVSALLVLLGSILLIRRKRK